MADGYARATGKPGVMLSHLGEWVIEFDRPTRKTKDGAKSDALDAIRAARETLGRDRFRTPRAHDGVREAIRVHTVTRAAAVRARTGAINELKAIIVTADETIRSPLRGLRTSQQVTVCARFRDRVPTSPSAAPVPACGPWPDASNTSTPRSTTTTGCSKN